MYSPTNAILHQKHQHKLAEALWKQPLGAILGKLVICLKTLLFYEAARLYLVSDYPFVTIFHLSTN
jgi:hypothetical protein